MKKILVVGVLTVLGFTNANAQKKFNFGVKGGLNFATISGDKPQNTGTVAALNLGVMSEISLSEKFSFQPELILSGQGYSLGEDIVAVGYLNVPLIGKYYLTKGLSLEAGPQLGFLLGAKHESLNVKDSFKPLDFSANFGLGYKLNNGLNFGARYNLGLTNINESNTSGKSKNSVIQVSIGYFFF